jgi:hypothetical protein
MLGQCFYGEGGLACSPKSVNRIDNPITQDAHAPHTPFPKPPPVREERWHIDGQWNMLQ